MNIRVVTLSIGSFFQVTCNSASCIFWSQKGNRWKFLSVVFLIKFLVDIFFKQGGSFSIIQCEVQQVYYAKIYLNDSSMSAFNNLQSAMLKTEKITFKKHRRLRSEPTVVGSSYLSGQALRGPQ